MTNMKDLGEKAQKDFIYKVIKYSDNEKKHLLA